MRYREFVEHVKASVRRVGLEFKRPDDDWAPVLITEFGEGPRPMALPPEAFESPESKDVLAAAIAAACRIETPHHLAMVTSCWVVKHPLRGQGARALDDVPPPSRHPRRFEAVVIQVADAERIEMHIAPIVRRRRLPPTLDRWELWEEGNKPGDGFSGRFVDDLRHALR